MRAVSTLVAIALSASLSAQTPATVVGGQPPPAPEWDAPFLQFEVASIKTNTSAESLVFMRTLPTSFNVTNVTLRTLITQAYRVSNYQLVGGSGWIDSERFDVVAKAPDGSRPDELPLMLRGLLADRFRLKVHGETRETQLYVLVLARSDGRLGPKLSKSTDDCETILAERRAQARPGGPGATGFQLPGPNEKPICSFAMRPVVGANGPPLMSISAGGQPLRILVDRISGFLNARVIDRTGLAGLYDFELQYSMQSALRTSVPATAPQSGATSAAPIDDGPTIFDAVRELGLKLESGRGPVEHLVIDSVERPTED